MTLSHFKYWIPRKVLVLEIFVPKRTKICIKSQIFAFFQVSSQIFHKTATATLVIFSKIVVLMTCYYLKKTACPGRFGFLRYLRRTLKKKFKKIKKIWIFSRSMAVFWYFWHPFFWDCSPYYLWVFESFYYSLCRDPLRQASSLHKQSPWSQNVSVCVCPSVCVCVCRLKVWRNWLDGFFWKFAWS